MKTSKSVALLVTFLISCSTALPLRAQWIQTNSVGPFDYTNTANWFGGVVNNLLTNATVADGLNIVFSSDLTLSSTLTMAWGGTSNVTFRSDSATPRTIKLTGNFVKTNNQGGLVTLGTVANPLVLDLNGATRQLGGQAGLGTANGTNDLYAQIIDSSGNTNGVNISGSRIFTYLRNDNNSFVGPVNFANLRGGGFTSIKNIGAGPSALGAPTDVTNAVISAVDATSQGSVAYLGTGDTSDRPFVWNLTGSAYSFEHRGSGRLTLNGQWTLPNHTNTLTISDIGAAASIELGGYIKGVNLTNYLVFKSVINTNRIVLSGPTNDFMAFELTNVVLVFNSISNAGLPCALGTNGVIIHHGNAATSSSSNPSGQGANLQYVGPSATFNRTIQFGGTGYFWGVDNAGTNTALTIVPDFGSAFTGSGFTPRFFFLNANSAATLEIQGGIPDVGSGTTTTVEVGSPAGYTIVNGGTVKLSGPTNSFSGGFQVKYARTAQVMTLADTGLPCSIGTGTGPFPSGTSMGALNLGSTDSQRGGTLAYIGTNDASCNRVITFLGQGAQSSVTILNNSPNNSRLHFSDAGPMQFNAAIAHAVVNLGGSAQAINILDESIANVPTNIASLIVNGSTWQLTATHSYSDITVVSNATLLVEGSIGPGADVSVQKNGVLGGNGVINNNVTVLTNGTLSPGGSIGLLTINGNLTNLGSIFMELNKAAGTNDHIVGLNNLVYGGVLVVTNLAGSLTTTDSFQLFSAATYSGSFSSISPATPGPGLAWDLTGLTNGTLKIVTGVQSSPAFTAITLASGNVILQGTNGTANATYYVISSTNVAAPVASWTRLGTNLFDGSGNFNFTNLINPALRGQFFRIQLP